MSINFGQGEVKEEDKVHQLFEAMEIGEKEFVPTNLGLEEATNYFLNKICFSKISSY
jgi:hypothetical protein